MSTPFQPPPDDEPLYTNEEFISRLEHDPEFGDMLQSQYEAALALPLNDDTAEMHKSAAAALKGLKHLRGARNAQKLLLQAASLRDDGSQDATEMLAQLKNLLAEATDHLLDVSEPERTRLMGLMAGLRERLAKHEKESQHRTA